MGVGYGQGVLENCLDGSPDLFCLSVAVDKTLRPTRETDVDNLEPLLKQLFSLLGEVVPHSLDRCLVGLVDVHIPDRASESVLGKVGILLAPNRMVKDKDPSGPSPVLLFSKRRPYETDVLGGVWTHASLSSCSVSG